MARYKVSGQWTAGYALAVAKARSNNDPAGLEALPMPLKAPIPLEACVVPGTPDSH